MPIDVAAALAAGPTLDEIAWTERDVLLYHLGIGAGVDPTSPRELRWAYEGDLQVLPTFALVAGRGISGTAVRRSGYLPGIDVAPQAILHGGQALTVHGPLPTAGRARLSSRVVDVWDKGKAAVIVSEQSAESPAGDPLWTTTMQIWARGEGGFGGDPGPATSWAVPESGPDHVLTVPTSPGQALLYRLNGDLNPLHADPDFARRAGFARPILHGLASYGIVCKAIVDEILDGEVGRLRSYSVRFAGTVTPGETIRTDVWALGERLLLRATCPERDGAPVLTHAEVVLDG
jgi:acyl dehydratase